MKLAQVKYRNKIKWGIIERDSITFLKEPPYAKIIPTAKKVALKSVKIIAPATPSKIICVGLNYRDHARELKMPIPDEPVIFLKPPTSLIGPDSNIVYPKGVKQLDYEGEMAIVISRQGKNIKEKDASKYILGYTCFNDITARDLQRKDGQWTRAKSFDTFASLGPWLVTKINPDNLRIQTALNGFIKQDSTTKNLIFKIPCLVSFISNVMTLFAGDVIATGTPFGVGAMKRKDIVEVCIEGIGALRNRVA